MPSLRDCSGEQRPTIACQHVAFVPPSDITNYTWNTPGLHKQYRAFPELDITKEEAKAVSPLFHVTKDDAPCLVFSGGKDTLVLPEQGRWIHEKMDEVGVPNKFILYKDSGHGLEGNVPAAMNETMKWFGARLQSRNSEQPAAAEVGK